MLFRSVIIASMYETYNFLNQKINEPINSQDLLGNYRKILSIFSPVLPHLTSECLEDLNLDPFQKWPSVDKNLLANEMIEYVIQVNGKKRGVIKAAKDIADNDLMAQILKDVNNNKIIKKRNINKIFFVKNRLINILFK